MEIYNITLNQKIELDKWNYLLNYFAANCEYIILQFWKAEESMINSFESYATEVETYNEIISMKFRPDIAEYIINNNVGYQIFYLKIESNSNILFSTEHYGKEVYMINISKNQLNYVEKIIPDKIIRHLQ